MTAQPQGKDSGSRTAGQPDSRNPGIRFLLHRIFHGEAGRFLSPEARSEAAWILLAEQRTPRRDTLERILHRATRRVERFRKPRETNTDRLDTLPTAARTPPACALLAEDIESILEVFETWPRGSVGFFLEAALFDTSYERAAHRWLPGTWTRHQARRLHASLRTRLAHRLRPDDEK